MTGGGNNAILGTRTGGNGGVSIRSPIEAKHTGKGKPVDVYFSNKKLSTRQEELLQKLPKYGSIVEVEKSKVNMVDLAALTAKTGVEYAMFTRGSKRLVVSGDAQKVGIRDDKLIRLAKNGYKFSGHTHVGTILVPSDGDIRALKKIFRQKRSVIYNSLGRYEIYGGE